MNKILIALANWFMLLTLPIWGGVAISYFVARDYFDKDKPYLKNKYDAALSGERLFWKNY